MIMQMVGHLELDGRVLPKPTIRGHWDGELVADMADGTTWTIFSMHPPPPCANRCPHGRPCMRPDFGWPMYVRP